MGSIKTFILLLCKAFYVVVLLINTLNIMCVTLKQLYTDESTCTINKQLYPKVPEIITMCSSSFISNEFQNYFVLALSSSEYM